MLYKFTSKKNTFEKKKYMYSNVYAKNFYNKYILNRRLYLKKKVSFDYILSNIVTLKAIDNISILHNFLYKNFISLSKNNKLKNKKFFENILKNFEIKNRIIEIKKEQLIHNYDYIEIYILLSLNISYLLSEKIDFRLLNTFLKCNDCIISLNKKKQFKNINIISYVINHEVMLVNNLL